MPEKGSINFSVRFPLWLYSALNKYCGGREMTRNWMIKKTTANALGLGRFVNDTPTDEEIDSSIASDKQEEGD